MPWRGPERPGEFPTLGYLVADWIETYCVQPDRHSIGEPFRLSDEQLLHLLWEYRLHPGARVDLDKPSAPFLFYGSVLCKPQKWGKGPFSATRVCVQARGPVLFAGWDANGDPVGMPWTTPHIQITAVSEDQTKNIWRVLKPMIEEGPLAEEIPDTGEESINLPGGGVIERTTSSGTSRLGQRVTWLEQDETHSWSERNGGHKLADTQRRNADGTGGRWGSTTNAYDPSENSVAQTDIEGGLDGIYINYPEPLPGSWGNARDRRRILKHAYKGAPWVDLDRIEAGCQRLARKGDPGQAERFFGNRVVAGADKAFDLELYKTLANVDLRVAPKRLITLGFDGSLTQDATGLVATDVELGHQVPIGWWERPRDLGEADEWHVPIDELNEAVAFAFEHFDVWVMNADPPHYRDDLNRWAGEYGSDKVVEWWTANRKKMAYALRDFKTDMRDEVMSHGPLSDDPAHLESHEALIRHVGNAVKRLSTMRDEEDGSFLWLIGKATAKSPYKIDLAMSAVLSWIGRGEAIRDGALKRPKYRRAAW